TDRITSPPRNAIPDFASLNPGHLLRSGDDARNETMRLTAIAAALALSLCCRVAAERIEVVPAIPGGVAVSIWMPRFPDAGSRHEADKAARESCRAAGGKARFIRSALVQRARHDQQ